MPSTSIQIVIIKLKHPQLSSILLKTSRVYCLKCRDHRALFRANTPAKEILHMVVPASLLLIFIIIVTLFNINVLYLLFRYTARDPSLRSETFHYERGSSQTFYQPAFTFDPSVFDEDEVNSLTFNPIQYQFHKAVQQNTLLDKSVC